ncbi:corrinoid protein [Moorella naiadis]|uniref:corrinoid protein n=1 Tax=Moorella naiadis (nom. illeg.) TaxID=3093670 RepID=UPI003D9C8385
MQVLEQLRKAVINGQALQAKVLTEAALEDGWAPYDILEQGLIVAMRLVGEEFRQNILYIPDVLMASRAMHAGMQVLKPLLSQSETNLPGRVVIGTVAGDLHDIGKNLVAMLLRSKGLEVIDLGIDVPPEEFVRAVVTYQPQILAMSALLTTTMPVMATTMQALQAMGLRQRVKVMVGGGPVTGEYAKVIQADGYAADARLAAEAALRLVGYPGWGKVAALKAKTG